jgi:hypothetical protein
MIIETIFCLALLCFTTAAQAFLPGYGLNRLYKVAEWNQLCAELGSASRVANCNNNVHRAVAYGRSLGPFESINPTDHSLLQSRSGVFFRNQLNDKITQISEDNGMRTTLTLENDVRCQAYAASPDLVGVPNPEGNYRRLVQSWLEVYSDEGSQIRSLRVSEQDGRRSLRFDAVTAGNRLIRGNYIFDAQANASIFSTCDHLLTSAEAQKSVELFFNSIVGSARRFI